MSPHLYKKNTNPNDPRLPVFNCQLWPSWVSPSISSTSKTKVKAMEFTIRSTWVLISSKPKPQTGALGGVQYQQSPSSSVLHSWPRPEINFSHPSDSLQQFTHRDVYCPKKAGLLFLLLFSHMKRLGIKLHPVGGQNRVPLVMSKPM